MRKPLELANQILVCLRCINLSKIYDNCRKWLMCQDKEKILRCLLVLYHCSEMQECVNRLLSHDNFK